MLLIDDYTRMTWVAFLKEKSEAFENLKYSRQWLKMSLALKSSVLGQIMVENLPQMNSMSSVKVMELRYNFPQQNGVVERKNRTVQEATRTMLNEAKLSNSFC